MTNAEVIAHLLLLKLGRTPTEWEIEVVATALAHFNIDPDAEHEPVDVDLGDEERLRAARELLHRRLEQVDREIGRRLS